MQIRHIPVLLLSFVIVGCSENGDEFHRILANRLYTNASCVGKYFQLSKSGMYVYFDNIKVLKLKEAHLVQINDNSGRIDQDFGESTLKIDIKVEGGIVHASPPYLDPPIPDDVWKYRESTGKGSKEALWAKILEASPPSITYPCGK